MDWGVVLPFALVLLISVETALRQIKFTTARIVFCGVDKTAAAGACGDLRARIKHETC